MSAAFQTPRETTDISNYSCDQVCDIYGSVYPVTWGENADVNDNALFATLSWLSTTNFK